MGPTPGVVGVVVLLLRRAIGHGTPRHGSIPEARTMTNDFLHIGMTLVTTVTLVRLGSRRA